VEHTLHRVQLVPAALDRTFEFFSRPENLARITPPWLGFRMVGGDADMREGLRIEYRVRPLGFPQKWVSEITAYDPPHRFVDEQVEGPYARWHHEHRFRAVDGGTEVTDTVTYALPLGPIGQLAHALLVRRQLESIFEYRKQTLVGLLAEGERPAES
jgi:ligand-binding SRPBCC domain-containing protein